ncbi:MAG: electron transfer flavoprotein subunit alpha/FixB family protein [Deltaproteobacteria bacterium]|nr:electron transfer flavoprotein subunit alpha/FixB family protein [Deltaproteobacteria bacterium]
MGTILIVGEIQNGKLREATLELVSFARQIAPTLGADVKSLLLGHGIGSQAEELSKKGGGEVLVADHELLASYGVDAYNRAVRAAIAQTKPDIVLVSNTPSGWDLAPRLAAGLDAAFVSDAFKIDVEDGKPAFVRRVFNGKLDARVTVASLPVVATVQPGATAAHTGSEPGSVSKLDVALSAGDLKAKFVRIQAAEAKGVDLTKADIIVSGGRSLGGTEKFMEVIKPLAEALGGAMGASRPVVDSGWLPHEYQVGSSGQTVTPKLYLAIGISGAIQHLVGMKNSNYIIAINKDPDAPIFEVANLGVVGDLFEVAPALTKAVKEAKGQ